MSVLKKSNKLKLVTAAAITTALAGYIQVAAEVPATSGAVAVQTQSDATLASVQFETPLCYAHTDRKYDAVLSLHKEKSGIVVGKVFGAKQAKSLAQLQPFEQSVQAKFVNNTNLSADVISQFEGRRVKSTDTLELSGDTVKFSGYDMNLGDCKTLVNSFLSRDIERRREAEEAAKRAF